MNICLPYVLTEHRDMSMRTKTMSCQAYPYIPGEHLTIPNEIDILNYTQSIIQIERKIVVTQFKQIILDKKGKFIYNIS